MPAYTPLKTKALGTVLQATISTVLTAITQRVSIDPANTTVDMKDVTDLDAALVEKLPTIADAGELGLQVWLDPHDPTHQFLETTCNTMAGPTVFVLSFPTTPKARLGTFSGFVSSWKPRRCRSQRLSDRRLQNHADISRGMGQCALRGRAWNVGVAPKGYPTADVLQWGHAPTLFAKVSNA